MGSRSPTMMKAQVSPGLRVKTKPQTEQRSNWDHPENSGPSPQCGQRLRNPRPSAVLMIFEREGVIHRCRNARLVGPAETRHYSPSADAEPFRIRRQPVRSQSDDMPAFLVTEPTAKQRRGGDSRYSTRRYPIDEIQDLARDAGVHRADR